MKKLSLLIFITCCFLCGCQPNPLVPQQGSPAINDINASLAEGIIGNNKIANNSNAAISSDLSSSLMPALNVDSSAGSHQIKQRFNISVNDVPAQSFFMSLVSGTKYNMVVDPAIKGTVTLDLKHVTIEDVLEAVHDIYGYQYQKTSYGFQVFPRSLETKVFTLNYLDLIRTGESTTRVSGAELSASDSNTNTNNSNSNNRTNNREGTISTEIKTQSISKFWDTVQTTISALVGTADGRQVIANPKAGTIIVKAYPNELRQVANYIDSMQKSMDRQVVIEAKFIEIRLSHDYQAGIDWSLLGGRVVQKMDNLVDVKQSNGATPGAIVINPTNGFANVIRMLSEQGNVQVLQSPRITTMNNVKAVFKIGTDEYHITNVSTTTQSTTTSPQTQQNVDLAPFFSGVALDVTPQIDVNGDVILHIHPVISKVTDIDKKFKINDSQQEIPLASSDVRESDSIVRAHNNQIIVIGGLMENKTEEQTNGAPFLSKAPIIGSLFRGTKQQSDKTELAILLKPTVIGANTWTNQLKQTSTRVNNLKRGYHFGGYPEVFGNEAEFQNTKRSQKYQK